MVFLIPPILFIALYILCSYAYIYTPFSELDINENSPNQMSNDLNLIETLNLIGI